MENDLTTLGTELERVLEEAERREATDEVVEILQDNVRQWKTLSRRLDAELDEVVRQARSDASIRAVASFLRLSALAASTYHTLNQAGILTGKEPAPATSPSADGSDSTYVVEESRTIRVQANGRWYEVSFKKGVSFENNDVSIGRAAIEQLNLWAGELPALICDTGLESCSAIPSDGAAVGDMGLSFEPAVEKWEPTSEEKNVFGMLTSTDLDWMPVDNVSSLPTVGESSFGDGARLTTGQRLALMGPDIPGYVVDFFGGLGDGATFGATSWVRSRIGLDDEVDLNSSSYQMGELVGWIAPGAALGGQAVSKAAYAVVRLGAGARRLTRLCVWGRGGTAWRAWAGEAGGSSICRPVGAPRAWRDLTAPEEVLMAGSWRSITFGVLTAPTGGPRAIHMFTSLASRVISLGITVGKYWWGTGFVGYVYAANKLLPPSPHGAVAP